MCARISHPAQAGSRNREEATAVSLGPKKRMAKAAASSAKEAALHKADARRALFPIASLVVVCGDSSQPTSRPAVPENRSQGRATLTSR